MESTHDPSSRAEVLQYAKSITGLEKKKKSLIDELKVGKESFERKISNLTRLLNEEEQEEKVCLMNKETINRFLVPIIDTLIEMYMAENQDQKLATQSQLKGEYIECVTGSIWS